jgi:peptidoglycan pentaglycine glycine transferase (the first glycine)
MWSINTQLIDDSKTWDDFVATQSATHLLQTWAWGELKTRFGWRALRLALMRDGEALAGAQILFRPLPLSYSLAYIPKGPMIDWRNKGQVDLWLVGLHRLCRSQRSAFLKVEPHVREDAAIREIIGNYNFVASPLTVQPPRTILVDIVPSEEKILARMKQKTRYNIRLAARKGVTVRPGTVNDIPIFYRLMQITGERDQFGIHSLDYFRTILTLFGPNQAALLLAEVAGEAVAGLIVLGHGSTAYYLFGASSNTHREKMPTYLLQWEAILWAKGRGYEIYDLWGIPDADETELEEDFLAHSQSAASLWGVYRFKRGFGGHVHRAVGAFDFVYNRPIYWAYRQWILRRRPGMLT